METETLKQKFKEIYENEVTHIIKKDRKGDFEWHPGPLWHYLNSSFSMQHGCTIILQDFRKSCCDVLNDEGTAGLIIVICYTDIF